jgi:hypothetical protein
MSPVRTDPLGSARATTRASTVDPRCAAARKMPARRGAYAYYTPRRGGGRVRLLLRRCKSTAAIRDQIDAQNVTGRPDLDSAERHFKRARLPGGQGSVARALSGRRYGTPCQSTSVLRERTIARPRSGESLSRERRCSRRKDIDAPSVLRLAP